MWGVCMLWSGWGVGTMGEQISERALLMKRELTTTTLELKMGVIAGAKNTLGGQLDSRCKQDQK